MFSKFITFNSDQFFCSCNAFGASDNFQIFVNMFSIIFYLSFLLTHLFHSWGHEPLFVCGSVGARQLFVTKKILNSEQCKLLIMMTNDDSDDDGSGGGDGNCDRISLSNGCFHRQRC